VTETFAPPRVVPPLPADTPSTLAPVPDPLAATTPAALAAATMPPAPAALSTATAHDDDRPRKPEEIEREADAIRQDLDQLLGELDRRRHRWMEMAQRAKTLAVPVAVGLAAIVGLSSGLRAWLKKRHRRAQLRQILAWR
jgi:hypothetical protein